MFKNQLFRYLIVGMYNTFLGYILYSFFLFLSQEYFFSYLLAYVLVSIKSYFLYRKFVFSNAKKESKYTLFALGHFLQYSLGSLLLWGFIHSFKMNEYIAGLSVVPFTMIFSYFYNKKIFTK